MTNAYYYGYMAYHEGYLIEDTPYPTGTIEYQSWLLGWIDAYREEILEAYLALAAMKMK
jgi:ribosome modulation factor